VTDAADLEYLLGVANHILPDAHVDVGHVVGSWAGLRPLVRPDRALPASAVSREHRLFHSPGGALVMTGGKLTTARLMGEEVVDAALERLGRSARATPSRSLEQPVSGGDIGEGWSDDFRRRAAGLGLAERQAERLAFRYGSNADRILSLVAGDARLGRVLGTTDAIVAEVRHAAVEDAAMTLSDVMVRRLGLSPWLPDGGLGFIDDVVGELAGPLGWDVGEGARQVEAYRGVVDANRAFRPA
jgi:glycerol-3-phosphate dehydrogenase